MNSEASDEELLTAVGGQDLSALEALYGRYGGVAFSLALRITRSRETAEEVVQESFFAVWRRASTYRQERGNPRSWVLSITHHRAIDVIRSRRARGQTAPLDEQAPLAGREDLWADVEQILDREAIRKAMRSLPEEQRQSIELAYFGGLTYPEIAAQTGVPLGTIKSRLRLGLAKLRVLLADAVTQEPEPQ